MKKRFWPLSLILVIALVFGMAISTPTAATAEDGKVKIVATKTGEGELSFEGTQFFTMGSDVRYMIVPAEGYMLKSVTVDGVNYGNAMRFYYFYNVNKEHTIEVVFEKMLTVEVVAGANGAVSPGTVALVDPGQSLEVAFTANKGYEVDQVLVNGVAVEVNGDRYLLVNITENTKVSVTFKVAENAVVAPAAPSTPATSLIVLCAVIVACAVALVLCIRARKNIDAAWNA